MNSTPDTTPPVQQRTALAFDSFHRGAYDDALVQCESLMPGAQSDATIRSLMGAIELARNNPARAVGHYTAATQLDAHNAESWYALAVALHCNGRIAEARANYLHALRINPSYATALENLGALSHQLGEYKEARDYYKRALDLKPRSANGHWNIALAYEQLKEYPLARQHMREAVELDTTQRAWRMRYISLLRAVDLDTAEKLCTALLSEFPDYAEAWNELGCIQLARRHLPEARAHFERALAFDPQHPYAHYHLGWVLMTMNEYAAGWREFIWRRKRADFSVGTTPPPDDTPEWQGQPLGGKRLLVKREQGLGDAIMFARFCNALTESGAHITLECAPKMAPLMRGISGMDRIVEPNNLGAEHYDYYVWLLDLPLRLGIDSPDKIPQQPYLRIDDARIQRWRKRLASQSSLRVGLIWRGNPSNALDTHRSVSPELLTNLAGVEQTEFVVLQRDATPAELDVLRRHLKIRTIDDAVDEDGRFLDTAAILCCLDLVISVDTSGAHLAGALGIPVWLLVATHQDWRWGNDETTNAWYPSITLYRQRDGDWSPALQRMRNDLTRMSANATSRTTQPLPAGAGAPVDTAETATLIAEGIAALRHGDFARAESFLARIGSDHPHYPSILNYRAVAAMQAGNMGQARQWLEDAVARAPHFADAQVNLARLLQDQGDTTRALKHYRDALKHAPNHAIAHANLGSLYHETRRIDEAVTHYNAACLAATDFAAPHNNLGLIALEQGRYDDAVRLFEKAIQLDSRFADAWCNLGNAHKSCGRIAQARQAYDSALAHDPSHAGAHWNRALLSLLEGHYHQAWADYAWGYTASERRARTFSCPNWRPGETLSGKTVLLYPEEGVGDEIFFARFIPQLRAACEHLIVQCDPRLQTLLQRSFPDAEFFGATRGSRDAAGLRGNRAEVALGANDILHALNIATPPSSATRQYLRADPALVATWRARCASLGAGLRVGISWHGGKDPQLQRERSIALCDWREILAVSGVHWFNLQYGDHRYDVARTERELGVTVHSYPELDPMRDLDNFAALLSTLDLVISVRNSTVHFAGALGVPTFVLLPISPEWRWGTEGDTSPWYPSVRVFRQRQPNDWREVIRNIAQQLAVYGKAKC